MKIITKKQEREIEKKNNRIISGYNYDIKILNSNINELEKKQNKIRDMLYETLSLKKSNVAKGTIFTRIKKIIDYIEKNKK